MNPGDCIFCKIASGAIPARKVLETEHCVAFLDVAPLAPGHTLLIPKVHASSLDAMPAASLAPVTAQLPALGKAIMAATSAEGYNVLLNTGAAAGQVVLHAHFHIIPRRRGDGLGYRWPAGSLADAEADALRERIAAGLAG
jgi:histidine triad (HIT) family protein